MAYYKKKVEYHSEYEHQIIFSNAGINVPKILNWNEDDSEITMEKIYGDVILSQKPYTMDLSLKLIDEIEKLHNLGYLHGDLNPTNVMISDTGDIILIDFEFSDTIGSCCISIEEEMMDLMRLLVILLNCDLSIIFNLMSLCEHTESSKLPFALKDGITYDDIRNKILLY